jgi:integrase
MIRLASIFSRPAAPTLADFLDDYAARRSLRPGSTRQMKLAVVQLCRWCGRELLVSDLTEKLVSDWLADYAASGKAPATVKGRRTAILILWRAAADAGLCSPPTRNVRNVRLQWKPATAWRPDEVQRLIAACRLLPREHPCGLRRAVWWELAVRVAWDSALRWGDQISLPVNVIQPDGTFEICQSKTSRPVTCRLSPRTLDLLAATLATAPRKLVTPWPASRESFQEQCRRLVRKAGIRPGTWRWLRRGSATDVERLHPGCGSTHLGHAPGSRIAERHYFDHSLLGREAAQPTLLD